MRAPGRGGVPRPAAGQSRLRGVRRFGLRVVLLGLLPVLAAGLSGGRLGEEALAGPLVVNGREVPESWLAGRSIKGATVTSRAEGGVVVTAPGYRWVGEDLLGPGERLPGAPAWWLLVEDLGSQGMTLDVFVNGARVQRVVSGARGVLVPLDGVLTPGANDVRLDVSGGGAGRMAATVARGVAAGDLVRFEGEPARYVVKARELGSLSFMVAAKASDLPASAPNPPAGAEAPALPMDGP